MNGLAVTAPPFIHERLVFVSKPLKYSKELPPFVHGINELGNFFTNETNLPMKGSPKSSRMLARLIL